MAKYTDGGGLDIIVDTVGGATLDASFAAHALVADGGNVGKVVVDIAI